MEGYATRTVDRTVAQAASYGPATGIYARRLLDGDAPWMMMRSVYRLIGLPKRYGPPAGPRRPAPGPDVDVINVSKIESMLKNATENTPAAGLAAAAGAGPGRFARDAAEYATATGIRLQVLDGGSDPADAGSGPAPWPAERGRKARRPPRPVISSPRFISFPISFYSFSLPRKEKERPLP